MTDTVKASQVAVLSTRVEQIETDQKAGFSRMEAKIDSVLEQQIQLREAIAIETRDSAIAHERIETLERRVANGLNDEIQGLKTAVAVVTTKVSVAAAISAVVISSIIALAAQYLGG